MSDACEPITFGFVLCCSVARERCARVPCVSTRLLRRYLRGHFLQFGVKKILAQCFFRFFFLFKTQGDAASTNISDDSCRAMTAA